MMYKKQREDSQAAGQASVIGANMEIVGKVKCNGIMKLSGSVKGDINCQELLVTPEATLEGTVHANAVRIEGTVNGTIKSAELQIGSMGRVEGEVFYNRIGVEPGASVIGTMHLESGKRTEPAKTESAASDATASTGGNPSSQKS